MTKILVTGINGFVGHHLANELRAQGHKVIGVGTDERLAPSLENIVGEYYRCDLSNIEEVRKLPLSQVEGLINLAGLAAVGPSFDNPELYMRVNTAVLSTVCTVAIEQNATAIKILAISSGAIYSPNQPMPLTETSVVDKTASPYAASKIAMEELAQQYRSKGLNCFVARPFNHIGPGQLAGFLLPDLYDKVTTAHKTGQDLLVGNLTTKRDYTDVRDVAKAYVSLVTGEVPKEAIYNVCSGKSVSGEEVLHMLIDILGFENLTPIVDEKLFRPSDAPDLYGDNSLLKNETGWSPSIDLLQTITDFVKSK